MMSTQTTTAAPLALHVPEPFTYVDRGLQRASDWIKYHVHPGLYRIHFTTIGHRVIPGNTRAEAAQLAAAAADASPYPVDRTTGRPYYAVATLAATKVESYYENQLFTAVSGRREEHDQPTTITWQPYAYVIDPGVQAWPERVYFDGKPSEVVYRAAIVEMQPCDECGAPAGERCEEGCQDGWDGWDGIVAANAGSAS